MKHERNPNYQLFLDTVYGRKDGQYDPQEATIATSQEIGWWKQHQVRRAIHHHRIGVATPPELHLLRKHHLIPYSSK